MVHSVEAPPLTLTEAKTFNFLFPNTTSEIGAKITSGAEFATIVTSADAYDN